MTDPDVLDRLVEVMTVDAYDAYEQISAFHAVFEAEAAFPASATVVGVSVLVTDVDIRANGIELTAHCLREGVRQEISLTGLVFPPDAQAAWVHAVYRGCLGLEPFPATIRRRLATGLAVTTSTTSHGRHHHPERPRRGPMLDGSFRSNDRRNMAGAVLSDRASRPESPERPRGRFITRPEQRP